MCEGKMFQEWKTFYYELRVLQSKKERKNFELIVIEKGNEENFVLIRNIKEHEGEIGLVGWIWSHIYGCFILWKK